MSRKMTGRLDQKRRGAVFVQVALSAVLLLGFTALTTDYGLLVINKRQLQNATDSAALAAGPSLGSVVGDTVANQKAYDVALETARRNGIPAPNIVVRNDAGSLPFYIIVEAQRPVWTPFAHLLSSAFRNQVVHARSKVAVYPTRSLTKLRPYGIPIGFFNADRLYSQIDFDQQFTVDLWPARKLPIIPPMSGQNTYSPFFVQLALGANSRSQVESAPYTNFQYNVKYGYEGIETLPDFPNGWKFEQDGDLREVNRRCIRDDNDSIMNQAAAEPYASQTFDNFSMDNPRVIFIEIVDMANGGRTQSPYGFAAFYIESFAAAPDAESTAKLTGRIIRYTVPVSGGIPHGGYINPQWYNYGVYQYLLVE